VESCLKDLGKTVMQTAAPDKMKRLTEALGFGPESDSEEEQVSASKEAARNPRKRRWTLKRAATTIQSWYRSCVMQYRWRLNVASLRNEAAVKREKQLRGLGGYDTKTQSWQGFQPVASSSGTPLTLDYSGKVASEPVWTSRYSLPEGSSERQDPTAAASVGRRRPLIPVATEPARLPAHTESEAAVGAPLSPGGVDPAARQLQRDRKLKRGRLCSACLLVWIMRCLTELQT
jgi:hypothetical protein